MINLLPPDLQASYRYGRYNVTLRRWVVAFAVTLVGLGGLATFGLLTLHQSTVHFTEQVSTAQAVLEKEQVTQTNKQVQDISNSLKLSVSVLSKEILFSRLITQIGAAMPSGSVLTGLTINKITGGLDLTAAATNYTTATQVQVNLADPNNKIFNVADIVSIQCSAQNATQTGYACSTVLRALFGSNNPYLFINKGAKP